MLERAKTAWNRQRRGNALVIPHFSTRSAAVYDECALPFHDIFEVENYTCAPETSYPRLFPKHDRRRMPEPLCRRLPFKSKWVHQISPLSSSMKNSFWGDPRMNDESSGVLCFSFICVRASYIRAFNFATEGRNNSITCELFTFSKVNIAFCMYGFF